MDKKLKPTTLRSVAIQMKKKFTKSEYATSRANAAWGSRCSGYMVEPTSGGEVGVHFYLAPDKTGAAERTAIYQRRLSSYKEYLEGLGYVVETYGEDKPWIVVTGRYV